MPRADTSYNGVDQVGRGADRRTMRVAAAERGTEDKAIAGLLFQVWAAPVGSGGAPLGRRAGCRRPARLGKPIRTALPSTCLKNRMRRGASPARDRITVQRSGLRPEPTDRCFGGVNGPVHSAPPRSSPPRPPALRAGSSGTPARVGLASRVLRPWRPAPPETILAGTEKLRAWFPITSSRPPPSRAPAPSTITSSDSASD